MFPSGYCSVGSIGNRLSGPRRRIFQARVKLPQGRVEKGTTGTVLDTKANASDVQMKRWVGCLGVERGFADCLRAVGLLGAEDIVHPHSLLIGL